MRTARRLAGVYQLFEKKGAGETEQAAAEDDPEHVELEAVEGEEGGAQDEGEEVGRGCEAARPDDGGAEEECEVEDSAFCFEGAGPKVSGRRRAPDGFKVFRRGGGHA